MIPGIAWLMTHTSCLLLKIEMGTTHERVAPPGLQQGGTDASRPGEWAATPSPAHTPAPPGSRRGTACPTACCAAAAAGPACLKQRKPSTARCFCAAGTGPVPQKSITRILFGGGDSAVIKRKIVQNAGVLEAWGFGTTHSFPGLVVSEKEGHRLLWNAAACWGCQYAVLPRVHVAFHDGWKPIG